MSRAIAALQRAAYQTEAALIGSDAIPPLHESETDIALLEVTIIGVLDQGCPIAILGYSRSKNVVDIDRLAVHPSHFRRGHARRLLETLHDREGDATLFQVSTGRDNSPALALYRDLRYRIVKDIALPEGVVITKLERMQSS